MLRDAVLVANKDLLIEARSKVGVGQILPFAFAVLLLFGFALDPDRGLLARSAPGLFWVTVLLSAILAIQRSFASEGEGDGMRLSGMDPAAIFLGKAFAVVVQLVLLEVVLAFGVWILYDMKFASAGLLAATAALATIGIAAAGTVYGVLANGARSRETLLPLLFLPVVAPVLLAAARASEAAVGNVAGGWSWVTILGVFAVIYSAVGTLAFGPLLEES